MLAYCYAIMTISKDQNIDLRFPSLGDEDYSSDEDILYSDAWEGIKMRGKTTSRPETPSGKSVSLSESPLVLPETLLDTTVFLPDTPSGMVVRGQRHLSGRSPCWRNHHVRLSLHCPRPISSDIGLPIPLTLQPLLSSLLYTCSSGTLKLQFSSQL